MFGQRVLITRPRRQAARLCDLLSELGAHCLLQPAIEIEPPADWSAVDAAMERLGEFDWLVFSSANGVEHFLGRLLSTGRDVRALGPLKIAAIGPATADALQQFHLQPDLTPDEYRERPCGSLGPEWAARTNLAAHTYSADGGWEATDGLRTFPRPLLSAVARGTATKKR